MDLLERIDNFINEKRSVFDKSKPSKEKCPDCGKKMRQDTTDGKDYAFCEKCEISFRR